MRRCQPQQRGANPPPVRGARFARVVLLCFMSVMFVVGGALQVVGAEGSYMTVSEAWSLAEANHPRVIEARQRLATLQRDVSQKQAAYLPNVTLSSTVLTLRTNPDGSLRNLDSGASVSAALKLPSGVSFNASASTSMRRLQSGTDGELLRGSVSLAYPLFRSPSLDGDALALRQAETALVVAQREYEQLRDEVRAEVLAALHGEQIAAARYELARAGLAEARQALEKVEHRVGAGVDPETERIVARLDVLRAEQDEIVASRTWETRRRQLAKLLGMKDDHLSLHQFESVLQWTALPAPDDLVEAMTRAVENSVSVWERVQAEEAARLQLLAERERSGFDARLEGGYSIRGTSDPGDNSTSDGWHVGLQVSYPLADGGQQRMALESREEAYERAQEAREAAEEAVRDEVREVFYELEDARRMVEIADLELTRARLELAAVKRQADLPVATVGAEAVQQGLRAVMRAELNYSEAVERYQGRWLTLQRLQGDVPWDALVARRDDGRQGSAATDPTVGWAGRNDE